MRLIIRRVRADHKMMGHTARFSRVIAAVLILGASVGFAALGGPTPASAAGSGSISGRVVDELGNPLANICARTDVSSSSTGAAGTYAILGLAAGSYAVEFFDCSPTPTYLGQWFQDRDTKESADSVAVFDGTDSPLPDVTMHPGVSVAGTVTDSFGSPIEGIFVTVEPSGGGRSGYGTTDVSGGFQTGVVADGDYTVRYTDPSFPPMYASEYWNDRYASEVADTVTLRITDGPVRFGLDASLDVAGSVSGTVRDTGGTPLQDICVIAGLPTPDGPRYIDSVRTQPDGTFQMLGLPPIEIRVYFDDCTGAGYSSQWYAGAPDYDSSVPVMVASGTETAGIDANLASGIRVGGTVTDTAGSPIPNIRVRIYPARRDEEGGDSAGATAYGFTNPAGGYTTSGLPPGDYIVEFFDDAPTPSWAHAYWLGQSLRRNANTLTLVASDGPVRAGVDAQLVPAATITGLVTNASGSPVGGICVQAFDADFDNPDWIGETRTLPTGSYSLSGLPPGGARVRFDDCDHIGPYVEQWYDGAETFEAATLANLVSGQSVSGVDAVMQLAGVITGTVSASGAPVSGICVQATTSTFYGGSTETDDSGTYSLELARPGSYRVQFIDCNEPPTFGGRWWGGGIEPSTAATVNVGIGQTVSGISPELEPAAPASARGTIRNVRGEPLTSACGVVYAPDRFIRFGPVDPDGTFSLSDIPSGTFAVGFIGCEDEDEAAIVRDHASGIGYGSLWWESALLRDSDGGPDPIAQGATLVTLHPNEQRSFDVCFGCGAITVSSVVKGDGSVTVSFSPDGLAGVGASAQGAGQVSASAALVYSLLCGSPSGNLVGATTSTSPISASGFTADAPYQCTLSASAAGVLVATAAAFNVTVGTAEVPPVTTPPGPTAPPIPSGSFPRSNGGGAPHSLALTGTDLGLIVMVAVASLTLGIAASVVAVTMAPRARRSP